MGQALLVGGPFDGTVVLAPDGDELLAETHLYESMDHWAEYRGERVRVFMHRDDCCGSADGDLDQCE